jgi:hypothetical protein
VAQHQISRNSTGNLSIASLTKSASSLCSRIVAGLTDSWLDACISSSKVVVRSTARFFFSNV